MRFFFHHTSSPHRIKIGDIFFFIVQKVYLAEQTWFSSFIVPYFKPNRPQCMWSRSRANMRGGGKTWKALWSKDEKIPFSHPLRNTFVIVKSLHLKSQLLNFEIFIVLLRCQGAKFPMEYWRDIFFYKIPVLLSSLWLTDCGEKHIVEEECNRHNDEDETPRATPAIHPWFCCPKESSIAATRTASATSTTTGRSRWLWMRQSVCRLLVGAGPSWICGLHLKGQFLLKLGIFFCLLVFFKCEFNK